MKLRDYIKEGLIGQLLMLAEELGRAPTAKEFKEDSRTANPSAATRLFGSWNKFLEAAGLEINLKIGYTKQELIEQLLMLTEELGKTPTGMEFGQDSRTAGVGTVIRLFGSWNEFLKVAGLEVNTKTDYTKEELIGQVLMLARELGRTPTSTEFNDDSRTASKPTVARFFGTWNEFLKAAGLGVNQKKNYTKEEFIRQVLMLARELGRTPTSTEFNDDSRTASKPTVVRFFGTWNEFLEASGLGISRRPARAYTKEELIDQVQMLAREQGRAPTGTEFNDDSRTASISAVIKLFGSWNEFLESAGLEINLKIGYTKQELIEQLLMLTEELGKTPTGMEFGQDSRTAGVGTVTKLFGSWNEFLKAAGLGVNVKRDYIKEELIIQLLMLAEELGRAPTNIEFDSDSRMASVSTVIKLFGSWNEFLKAADLEPKYAYTKEKLIGQLLTLAEELGRAPTAKEFKEDSRTANPSAATRLFGSWNKFLEAAGLEINLKIGYTKQELIEQLLMLTEELGKTPTGMEFGQDSRTASVGTVIRLFGSWNKFVEVARLKPNRVRKP